MLATLVESANSPLLQSDIIGIDKQDDHACTQLLSSAIIRQISLLDDLRSELGLTIFLWNAGEAVDTQQSRTIPHLEHIKMLWCAQVFFDSWRQYVLDHPHYSVNTHFITHELYDIISIFINVMLMMILIHRDFFPKIPLLLWLSSTEVCEHFFGCVCKIQKDFTFAEWILMIPKLVLLMMGVLKAKGSQANTSKHHSGYHHSWFDTKNIDMKNLSTYPSDMEIQECINVVFQEASTLLNILGIQNSTSGGIEDPGIQLADAFTIMNQKSTANADTDAQDTGADAAHKVATAPRSEESDLTLVDKPLVADNVDDLAESQSNKVDQKMTNLGIAATAIVIHDTLRMYVSTPL
jgi:hypothetical protein